MQLCSLSLTCTRSLPQAQKVAAEQEANRQRVAAEAKVKSEQLLVLQYYDTCLRSCCMIWLRCLYLRRLLLNSKACCFSHHCAVQQSAVSLCAQVLTML